MSAPTRLLGVDYGEVRIGLAVSDAERRIATPLTTYTRNGAAPDAVFFQQLAKDEDIGLLVVGLPIHLDGHEGSSALAARKLGDWLSQITGLTCVYWDERFTTAVAESALWDAGLTHKRRKARRDRVAAQMMLQSYMEAGCPGARSK